ncbi:MAG: ATP-binding protein, partial [Anaerolineae bacterium]|nr:ATP-binding protein [Anaerolineae bacterium]
NQTQQNLWRQVLGDHTNALNGYIPTLTAQFRLSPSLIRAAAEDALAALPTDPAKRELQHHLWDACRRQARFGLDDLATRIETRYTWDDLVLPEQQMATLQEIVIQVAQRAKVYETWGFGANVRGTGTAVIFAGSSGTGKTLAAEVMANALRLDLYRVDLSGVVSKYIGETEKNLRRIFSAAEYGGAILLFDEADALFGKRSEVRDSHDRYANIEVSYLLQQMESYRGLAILTTNMLDNFDRAFLRRIRFIVQFPFPNAELRAEIWGRIFPVEAPTAALDLYKLARLNITGGSIRNIALNAAFLAADKGEAIGMKHLLRASVTEFAKLEKPLPEAEMQDWIEP